MFFENVLIFVVVSVVVVVYSIEPRNFCMQCRCRRGVIEYVVKKEGGGCL